MDENFRILCMQHFDSVDLSNFTKELERSLLIKKAIKKYYTSGFINLRLLLNHHIILFNYFGSFGTVILFRVIPKNHCSLLNTILIFLDRLPETLYNSNIQIEKNIQQELDKL
jgi:hypothetical protein